jgi:hypothetical protein
MEWDQLQIKHFSEWKEFEKEKSLAWRKMNDKHEEMRQVFKNDPVRLPAESAALIKTEKEKWESDWGKDGRKRLRLVYRQQRDTERLIKQQERARRVFEITDEVIEVKKKTRDRGR